MTTQDTKTTLGNLTEEDARLRVLDARTGALPKHATANYLSRLRREVACWLDEIDDEIGRHLLAQAKIDEGMRA